MSPRSTSTASSAASRSASAPYTSRKPSGQPKSTRQQFSACGACRMRRVRCDLKDLPIESAGPNPSCSNCKERGLKCVDEFADVKAVKLLRRGRRLQQVEAIYGKTNDQDNTTTQVSQRLPSLIPDLHADFFASPFWRWFSIQRPILGTNEFPARFLAHVDGTQSLGHEGGIIALLLVVWAATFGLDERGLPLEDEDASFESSDHDGQRVTRRASAVARSDRAPKSGALVSRGFGTQVARKEKVDTMLREVLELIDFHGVLRRPTYDGVRALLLIQPLLEESPSLHRITMQEAALSHVRLLCDSIVAGPPSASMSTSTDEALIRTRIFWYAHIQEAITTGMRGGRLVLNNDDLDAFQSTLPSFPVASLSGPSGLPSPVSPTFPPHSTLSQHGCDGSSTSTHPYLHLTQLFSVPLHLGAVCRRVHSVLTSAKAVRRIEHSLTIDATSLTKIWDELESCWEQFETIRRTHIANGDLDLIVDRFVSGWQIFIFECYNRIRESLKRFSSQPSSPHPVFASADPHQHGGHSPPPVSANQLHIFATNECLRLLPSIICIIKRHLSSPLGASHRDPAGLFKWDTGLVRDGIFFAAVLSAGNPDDEYFPHSPGSGSSGGGRRSPFPFKQESEMMDDLHCASRSSALVHSEDAVRICLGAIGEMEWMFSKRDEREDDVQRVFREAQLHHSQPTLHHTTQPQFNITQHSHLQDMDFPPSSREQVAPFHDSIYPGQVKGNHNLPRLLLVPLSHAVDSAPSTANSPPGSAGWVSYTPPSTATSASSAPTTHLSSAGSPVFNMAPGNILKESEDYYPVSDLGQFSFSVPGYPDAGVHGISASPTPYLDFVASGMNIDDSVGGCPQFSDDCVGSNYVYH